MGDNVPDYFHFDHLSGVTQLDTEHKNTMMEVTNHSEESVDVVEHRKHFGQLEKSTGSFLRTLDVWRTRTNFDANPLPYDVVVTRSLVADYVAAYEVGMSAAQDGYNFATSGLSYATIVTSDISSKERHSYIDNMQSFATQGKHKSEQALESMRELRRKLNSCLDKMKTMSENDSADVAQNEIAVFEKNLSILLQFEECMDWYIKWWTKTGMTSSHQDTNVTQYARSGGDLRLRGIQLQWQNLQNVYFQYRTEMQKLQDKYSRVFKLVHDLKPSDAIDIPITPPPKLMVEGRTVEKQGISKMNAPRHKTFSSPPTPTTADAQVKTKPDGIKSTPLQVPATKPRRQNSEVDTREKIADIVPRDNTPPKPSATGRPHFQEGTTHSDEQQKSKEHNNHSSSTSEQLTQPWKSANRGAPIVNTRISSRRNRKPSDEGQKSNKIGPITASTPPEGPPLDDALALLKAAWTTDEGQTPEKNAATGETQGLKPSESIEKPEDEGISIVGTGQTLAKLQSHHKSLNTSAQKGLLDGRNHTGVFNPDYDSKSSDDFDILTNPMPGPTPTVERQKTGKQSATPHANSSLSTPLTGDRQVITLDRTESTQRQVPPRNLLHQSSKVDNQKKLTETVPVDQTLKPSVDGPSFQEGSALFDLQKAKDSHSHSNSTGGRLVETPESENGSTPIVDTRSSGRRNQKQFNEGQNSDNKSAPNIVPPAPKVSSLDDPFALLKAWTIDERKSPQPVEKDISILVGTEGTLGDTDKSLSYHDSSIPPPKNGSLGNRQQIVQTNSKLSDRPQNDRSSSGSKRRPSDDHKISSEAETGGKVGGNNTSGAKNIAEETVVLPSNSGRGKSVSEKVETRGHGIHGSNEEAHLITPSTSSFKTSFKRSSSKHSAQARIQPTSPYLGILPVPPTPPSINIELSSISTSLSNPRDNIEHSGPLVLNSTRLTKTNRVVEQPAQPKNSPLIQSSSSSGGAWLDPQLRRDSPKDDWSFPLPNPLPELPINVSKTTALRYTLSNASGTRLTPSQPLPPNKRIRGDASTESVGDSLATSSSRAGQSGSGRHGPKLGEGKSTTSVQGEEGSSQEVLPVANPTSPTRISSKQNYSNLSSDSRAQPFKQDAGRYPLSPLPPPSNPENNSGVVSQPSQLRDETTGHDDSSKKKTDPDLPSSVSTTLTKASDTAQQATLPGKSRPKDSSSLGGVAQPERQKSSAPSRLSGLPTANTPGRSTSSHALGTTFLPPPSESVPPASNPVASAPIVVSVQNAGQQLPGGKVQTRGTGSESGGGPKVAGTTGTATQSAQTTTTSNNTSSGTNAESSCCCVIM